LRLFVVFWLGRRPRAHQGFPVAANGGSDIAIAAADQMKNPGT
jgi:hypothetical protein